MHRGRRGEKGRGTMAKRKQKKASEDKPELCLTECDGNAFAIIGRARDVGRRAGWAGDKIEAFTAEAQSGNYDNVLQTCFKYFDVT